MIDISKESAYYDDSYIRFVDFNVKYQKLRAWENLPDCQKRGETTPKSPGILMKITPSDFAYPRTLT